jgi:hypothetical protein
VREQGEASRLGLLLLFLFAIGLTGFGSRQSYVLSSIFLTLEIGQRGSSDFIELSGIPLDLSGSDEEQVITVGNIRPGTRRRVYLEARDETGSALASARYSVNFYPGNLTTHVARLRIRSERAAPAGSVALQEPSISIETRGVESLFFEAALDDITLGGTIPFGPDQLILEDPDAGETEDPDPEYPGL